MQILKINRTWNDVIKFNDDQLETSISTSLMPMM